MAVSLMGHAPWYYCPCMAVVLQFFTISLTGFASDIVSDDGMNANNTLHSAGK